VRRGVTRSRGCKSGGFSTRQFGKHLVQADTSGKAGAHDLGFGDIQQSADHCRRIAFNVAKQEKQTLVCREVAHCHLKVGTANIAVVEPGPRNENCWRFFVAERKALAQLLHECRIDCEGVGPFLLLKSAHESNGKNLFRFYLIPRHIEGKGEGAVTVTFVHILLLLLGGLLGSLGDNEVRFCGKLTLKVEQSYPASLRIETTLHPVALVALIMCESEMRSAFEYNSLLYDQAGDEEFTPRLVVEDRLGKRCFTITVT
jgi:hypothetical protein